MYVLTANQVLQEVTRRVYDMGDFYQRLYEEMNRAQRYRRPLSLLLVNFSAAEPEGVRPPDLSQAINEAIRLPDIVGRLSKQTAGLLLVETSRNDSRDVLRRIRSTLNDPPGDITTYAGLAPFRLSTRADAYFPPEASGSYLNHTADLLAEARQDGKKQRTRPFQAETWRSTYSAAQAVSS